MFYKCYGLDILLFRKKKTFTEDEYFAFDDDMLQAIAQRFRESYQNAHPFPHIVIDDFLPTAPAERVRREFPSQHSPIWLDWTKRDVANQPKKQGIGHASRLKGVSPYVLNMLQAFNTYPFIHFLETLTGIDKLIPDPHFHGGGLIKSCPAAR